MRTLLVALVVLVFSTPGFAQTLSGNQIRQMLIGRTISGVDKGESYSEYLNPNGTIAGHSAAGDYSGKWRINDDEICFLDEDSKDWDCNEVRLRGNQIIWDDGTTATLSGQPVPGAAQMPYGPQNAPAPIYRTARGYAPWAGQASGYYAQPGSYYIVQPSPCPVRGLFGGFCNCGCAY